MINLTFGVSTRLAYFWQIGLKQWRYYDFGPKVVPPLICLPGTAGTADVYYKQVMSLSMKVVSLVWRVCHILIQDANIVAYVLVAD